MRRLSVLCLLLVLLLPTLAACGNKNPSGTPTNPATGGKDSATEPSTDDILPEPDADFSKDGVPTDFVIAARADRYGYLFCDDANTKDTVEAKTYSRNRSIEEDYGIRFKILPLADTDGGKEFVTKLQTADIGDIDLVCWDYWWGLEQTGSFVDLQTLSELNLDRDWYYAGWNDNVTINGISYSCAGDATLEVLQNIEVMFYNRTIAEANGLNLKELVDDGEWTIAKMREIAEDVSQNVDGNAEDTVWGATYDLHSARAGMFAAGLKFATVSKENGAIQITLNSSLNVDLTDAFGQMLKSPSVLYSATTARGTDIQPFVSGKTFLLAGALIRGTDIKNTMSQNFDYGIVPAPKYLADADYVSTSYGVSVFSIPKVCESKTRSAVVLEVMMRRSGDTIVKTFYENVLKYKVAEKAEDSAMIDMIREKLYFDFAFTADGTITILGNAQGKVINGESLATVIAEYALTAKSQLEKLLAVYQ